MVFEDDHGGWLLSWCDQRLSHHYPTLHRGNLWSLADDDHNRTLLGGEDDRGSLWYILVFRWFWRVSDGDDEDCMRWWPLTMCPDQWEQCQNHNWLPTSKRGSHWRWQDHLREHISPPFSDAARHHRANIFVGTHLVQVIPPFRSDQEEPLSLLSHLWSPGCYR